MDNQSLTMIATIAWFAGGSASKNEFELAERAKTPAKRAEHTDRAMTLNLASNIGAGYALYNLSKTRPKLTVGALMAYFLSSSLLSSHDLGRTPFIDGLLGRSHPRQISAPPPAETAGWGLGY
jgi:hypothetical protein